MTQVSRQPDTNEQFGVIYQCPDCEQRFLGERRCPDCQLFCRRLGPGGDCPHCDEPVAINDLMQVTRHQKGAQLDR